MFNAARLDCRCKPDVRQRERWNLQSPCRSSLVKTIHDSKTDVLCTRINLSCQIPSNVK